MATFVIADNPRRVLRTEFALLLNRFRKPRLTRSLKLSLHFVQLMTKPRASTPIRCQLRNAASRSRDLDRQVYF